jgi:hypothetical protein
MSILPQIPAYAGRQAEGVSSLKNLLNPKKNPKHAFYAQHKTVYVKHK